MEEVLSKDLNNGIKLLGDDWTLCIVSSLSKGGLRYCGIQRALNNVNPATLTNRLKKLEELDIVKRNEETVDKLSVVYELTDKGKAILPIINEIEKFSDIFLK